MYRHQCSLLKKKCVHSTNRSSSHVAYRIASCSLSVWNQCVVLPCAPNRVAVSGLGLTLESDSCTSAKIFLTEFSLYWYIGLNGFQLCDARQSTLILQIKNKTKTTNHTNRPWARGHWCLDIFEEGLLVTVHCGFVLSDRVSSTRSICSSQESCNYFVFECPCVTFNQIKSSYFWGMILGVV